MPYVIASRHAIARDQSKHVGEDGALRYSADGSEVFPGATGVRPTVETHRRAVATVEEARKLAHAAVDDGRCEWHNERDYLHKWINKLSETGGVIGPMPDGYVIDVQPIAWTELWAIVRPDPPADSPLWSRTQILVAFNEQ